MLPLDPGVLLAADPLTAAPQHSRGSPFPTVLTQLVRSFRRPSFLLVAVPPSLTRMRLSLLLPRVPAVSDREALVHFSES